MSDRAMIPLAIAGMLGFICGLLASVLQLTGGSAVTVGLIAAVVSAGAALASIVGVRAERGEITIVALLRAGLAATLAVFLYAGMLAFLRDGKPLIA
ncbi:MAG: hypothetical protein HZB46_08915, partial [Solirubrobacterales bacterium]|nr:hypothetical protein [Solirubrobacterales bacterium]